MNEPSLYGKNLFDETVLPQSRGKVSDDFLISPFTVLSARDGFWQERKNTWLGLGIKGEVGRAKSLLGFSASCEKYMKSHKDYAETGKNEGIQEYSSVFDPVLCELSYRWFCKEGDLIIDPFAGGSVRGILAEQLNRKYYGIELREEQVNENREQAKIICGDIKPLWVCGDSMELLSDAPECDFIFTCPPYGNLEVYSNDVRDLSNMEYHTFIAAYKRIIMRACLKLRNNRFACIVVGDFRDEKGNYRNFVSDTITSFLEQGLKLYNEAILVTPVASLAMRVRGMFESSRKLGKTHQNVLVFVKGEGKVAASRLSEFIK